MPDGLNRYHHKRVNICFVSGFRSLNYLCTFSFCSVVSAFCVRIVAVESGVRSSTTVGNRHSRSFVLDRVETFCHRRRCATLYLRIHTSPLCSPEFHTRVVAQVGPPACVLCFVRSPVIKGQSTRAYFSKRWIKLAGTDWCLCAAEATDVSWIALRMFRRYRDGGKYLGPFDYRLSQAALIVEERPFSVEFKRIHCTFPLCCVPTVAGRTLPVSFAQVPMADIAVIILSVVAEIRDVVEGVEENNQQARRLSKRVTAIEPPVLAIQQGTKATSPESLRQLLGTVKDIRSFLKGYLQTTSLTRAWRRNANASRFAELGAGLTEGIQALHFGVAVDAWAKEDALDRFRDAENLVDTLEAMKRNRTDNHAEVKALLKVSLR